MVKAYLILMRPSQYVKNLFIFLPSFFGLHFTDPAIMANTSFAFLLFCAAASGVYVFNDCLDRDDDRMHPVKKNRPIASGAVSRKAAVALIAVLVSAALAGAFILNFSVFVIMLVYIALNVFYTVLLKHIALVDVAVIAVGFVLRLFVGSAVSGSPLSMWIIIMTFLLALFLAFAKRREDVMLFVEKGEKARKVIDGYNLEFLNVSMIIMAAVIIISYVMYTISPSILARLHGDKTYLTMLWVVLGILRYLQLSFVFNNTGNPTKVLLTDRYLQIVIAGWVVSFWCLIYL